MGLRTAGPVAALLVLTALGAGCGVVTSTSAAAPPSSPIPVAVPQAAPPPSDVVAADGPAQPCTGSTLDISATAPRRDEGGAAVQELVFRNTGELPCLMRGYPGVGFVAGNEGTRIGPRAAATGPRAELLLEPGRAATAPLRVADAADYPEAGCRAQEVRGMRVAPPGGSGGLFVPRPGAVCSGEPDVPQATVGTVTGR
ncbi:DUF4232 domain-containing protein [Pseudonocardia nematodicida]|uniref:DUF4232 domain-containing protein n=1 Tax=Pseudonocardia nematodicida TaxID=1206997 RepID=A0ABV1K458_9PSEU